MGIMDEETRNQLEERLQKEMRRGVELILFVDDDVQKCPLCPATKQFLEELSELSDKIVLKISGLDSEDAKKFNVTKTPTLLVDPNKGYKIIYTGAPLGYEAAGLVETIILVSNDESKLSPDSKQKLKSLDEEKHIEIFVTPTCPYCPKAALLANMIAIEAKGKVKTEIIEAIENPDLAMKYNIQAVPHNVINGKTSSIGVQPEEEFVNALIEG